MYRHCVCSTFLNNTLVLALFIIATPVCAIHDFLSIIFFFSFFHFCFVDCNLPSPYSIVERL